MKTETIKIAGKGGAALLAALALAGGCGTPPPPSVPARHLYVGLDTSASFRPCLGLAATLCARQALRLDPDRDRLTLYRLDSSTREFSDGPAPESGERLQRTIIAEVQSVSSTRGTFPARFWTAVAARVPGDAAPVAIEIFSDGDNDDQSRQAADAIRRAARALAADPHVESVSVLGAAPRNWATLRAEFAPLGDRFHLCGPTELTMDQMDRALDAAH